MTDPCPGCLRVTSRSWALCRLRGRDDDAARVRGRVAAAPGPAAAGSPRVRVAAGIGRPTLRPPTTDVDHVIPKVHGGSDEEVSRR